MFRVFKISLLSVLVATFLVGCKTTDLEKRIAALEDKNTELSNRLDEVKELGTDIDRIKERVGALEARPAAPRPPRPAQESAYNLPVGNSFVLGKR